MAGVLLKDFQTDIQFQPAKGVKMKDKIGMLGIVGMALLSLLFAPLSTAHAAGSVQTDLIPPPPDWYTCYDTGNGAICQGKMTFEDQGGYDGSCPQGFDILENSYKQETGTRYYNRDGYLIKRVLRDVYPVNDPRNILYNSVTGKSVPQYGDIVETDTFAVPGDFGSMTARITGNLYTVTQPGNGILVHDVGVFTFAPDGSILEDRGPKMLFYGDTDKLCAALA